MYKSLSADHITRTIDTLARRVGERFPNSGLSKVAVELTSVARDMRRDADALSQPNWRLRLFPSFILGSGVLIFWLAVRELRLGDLTTEAVTIVQIIEPAANIAIIVAIGILFIVRSEERWKQKSALRSLHSLRSMIHVVDMHQLTKDPSAMLSNLVPTESSPKRQMTPAELVRYLDYCSEMLSLIAKIAALYAQSVQDRVVVDSVNELEVLSTNLSRKIWQKIMIIDHFKPNIIADASADA